MDITQDPEYRAAFDKLFQDVGFILKNHLNDKDPGKAPVFRVLNVLAIHTATVIAGTDDPLALEFFSQALNVNILQIRKDFVAKKIQEDESAGH